MATKKQTPSVVKAVQPSATLEIDGRKYELVYDYNAIAEAEAATGGGCNLLHGLVVPASMNAVQMRGVFFAALRTRHPEMSISEAGQLLRVDTIAEALRAIGESWALSMPEPKANPPKADGEKPPSGD
jgi:hypothetical protein